MKQIAEDTRRNTGTIFFIILFSLFILIVSNGSGNVNSILSGNTLHSEHVIKNLPVHSDAILVTDVNIPDLYRNGIASLEKSTLDQYSFHHIISGLNSILETDLSCVQRSMLTIEPLLLWRLSVPAPGGEKEDLPVLS